MKNILPQIRITLICCRLCLLLSKYIFRCINKIFFHCFQNFLTQARIFHKSFKSLSWQRKESWTLPESESRVEWMIRRHLKVIFSVMVNVSSSLFAGHSRNLTVFVHRNSHMTHMRGNATFFFSLILSHYNLAWYP